MKHTPLSHDGVSGEFVEDGPGSYVRITGIPETFHKHTSRRSHEEAFRTLVADYHAKKALWAQNHERIEGVWASRSAIMVKVDLSAADLQEIERIETQELAPLLGDYSVGDYIRVRMHAWALDAQAQNATDPKCIERKDTL